MNQSENAGMLTASQLTSLSRVDAKLDDHSEQLLKLGALIEELSMRLQSVRVSAPTNQKAEGSQPEEVMSPLASRVNNMTNGVLMMQSAVRNLLDELEI